MKTLHRFRPAVTKKALLFLAGFTWICVGAMLLAFSCLWLSGVSRRIGIEFVGIGIAVALLVHHFGFLKIADRNSRRILSMDEKKCLFSFITWKSYMIILVMVTIGITLRHSELPRHYLAILYTGIGLALILSSFRYMRVFVKETRDRKAK
ncbi:MAG: hypothetical protein JRJ29_14170 [Deltaproteobacteria bacterium]|nr:hypothetical protein [Deltaproteobacteria bacterium]